MNTQLMKKLNDLFCEVFNDDSILLTVETTADEVEGWDSLSHVNLILAVETRFNIRFTQRELLSFQNVGDLLNCIEKKTV